MFVTSSISSFFSNLWGNYPPALNKLCQYFMEEKPSLRLNDILSEEKIVDFAVTALHNLIKAMGSIGYVLWPVDLYPNNLFGYSVIYTGESKLQIKHDNTIIVEIAIDQHDLIEKLVNILKLTNGQQLVINELSKLPLEDRKSIQEYFDKYYREHIQKYFDDQDLNSLLDNKKPLYKVRFTDLPPSGNFQISLDNLKSLRAMSVVNYIRSINSCEVLQLLYSASGEQIASILNKLFVVNDINYTDYNSLVIKVLQACPQDEIIHTLIHIYERNLHSLVAIIQTANIIIDYDQYDLATLAALAKKLFGRYGLSQRNMVDKHAEFLTKALQNQKFCAVTMEQLCHRDTTYRTLRLVLNHINKDWRTKYIGVLLYDLELDVKLLPVLLFEFMVEDDYIAFINHNYATHQRFFDFLWHVYRYSQERDSNKAHFAWLLSNMDQNYLNLVEKNCLNNISHIQTKINKLSAAKQEKLLLDQHPQEEIDSIKRHERSMNELEAIQQLLLNHRN